MGPAPVGEQESVCISDTEWNLTSYSHNAAWKQGTCSVRIRAWRHPLSAAFPAYQTLGRRCTNPKIDLSSYPPPRGIPKLSAYWGATVTKTCPFGQFGLGLLVRFRLMCPNLNQICLVATSLSTYSCGERGDRSAIRGGGEREMIDSGRRRGGRLTAEHFTIGLVVGKVVKTGPPYDTSASFDATLGDFISRVSIRQFAIG